MDGPNYRFEANNSLFPEMIETERLRLEQLCRQNVGVLDLYEFLGTDAITEATEHLNWEPHATPNDTKHLIEHFEKQWQSGEQAGYLIRPDQGGDEDGQLAGVTTLTVDWNRRVADLGIFLQQHFWGREYSRERAKALLGLAFETLGLEVAEMSCSAENERAKHSIEKYVEDCGGEYVGVRYNMVAQEAGDPIDCHLFTITNEQFRQ